MLEVVSEVEYRTTVDVGCAPVVRGDDGFGNDVVFNVVVSQLTKLLDDGISVIGLDVVPYDGFVGVWYWNKNINSRVTFRSEAVIGNACVLNVDRRVIPGQLVVGDVVKILFVC